MTPKQLIEKFYAGQGRTYANGWSGPGGILAGLRALRAGDTEECRFFVADHHLRGDTTYYATTVTFNGETFRYADGGYECRLGPAGSDDPAEAAVDLVAELYRRQAEACAKQSAEGYAPNVHVFRDVDFEGAR
jgi:hypothetical protein